MVTKTLIRKTAHEMATAYGLLNLTRAKLCERVGIPGGSFQHIMGVSFAEFIEDMGKRDYPAPLHTTPSRAYPSLRRASILASAIYLASVESYSTITRGGVAAAAGVSPSLVARYFESMDVLRAEIMETAIKKGIPRIVAQGLANNDTIAQTASPALRRRASKILIES